MPAFARGALLAAIVTVAACGPATPSTGAPGSGPPAFAGLRTTQVELGPLTLRVAIAESSDARARGLTGVVDLGQLDGLLLSFPAPASPTFHMRGVSMPLDIAFVGPDGLVLGVLTMPVCPAAPCPGYDAPAPIGWAVEAPAGRLAAIRPGDRLVVS